jgi:hypothetical protein
MAFGTDTGGFAYPMIEWKSPDGMYATNLSHGMTLRDYFAVHCDQPGEAEIIAAAGLTSLSSAGYFVTGFPDDPDKKITFTDWWREVSQEGRFRLYAKVRYAIADAMIAERSNSTLSNPKD